jgi:hypothetical protein
LGEQRFAMSELWATAMGAWSDDFADLMLPFDRLALSRADVVFMGNGTPGFSYSVTDPCPDEFSQMLKSDLGRAMSRYPMGAHLRLDLCSFRTGAATPRVVGMNGALWLMRQANSRVSGVIRRGVQDGQALSLFIFPWLPIPQWAEFRVFVRQGKMVGATQLHADQVFAQIAQHEAAIKAALDVFVAAALPRLKQPDVVLDVLAEPVPQAGFRIRLVEMALMGPRTDFGLFGLEPPEAMDGSFRFRRAEVTVNMPIPLIEVEQTLHPSVMGNAKSGPPAPEDDFWRT